MYFFYFQQYLLSYFLNTRDVSCLSQKYNYCGPHLIKGFEPVLAPPKSGVVRTEEYNSTPPVPTPKQRWAVWTRCGCMWWGICAFINLIDSNRSQYNGFIMG